MGILPRLRSRPLTSQATEPDPIKLKLQPHEIRFLGKLIASGVEYAIVGGAAVNFHGYDRERHDLDILIRQTPENITRLIDAGIHGFRGKNVDEWMQDGVHTDQKGPFDILTKIDGVDARLVIDTGITGTVDGLELSFISRELLIASKEAVGDEKDLDDIKFLKAKPG